MTWTFKLDFWENSFLQLVQVKVFADEHLVCAGIDSLNYLCIHTNHNSSNLPPLSEPRHVSCKTLSPCTGFHNVGSSWFKLEVEVELTIIGEKHWLYYLSILAEMNGAYLNVLTAPWIWDLGEILGPTGRKNRCDMEWVEGGVIIFRHDFGLTHYYKLIDWLILCSRSYRPLVSFIILYYFGIFCIVLDFVLPS